MDATDPQTAQVLTLPEMVAKYFAPGEGDRSRLLTTTDIFDIIDEHAPKRFSSAEMHEVLTALHFQARAIGDVIYWSVRNL